MEHAPQSPSRLLQGLRMVPLGGIWLVLGAIQLWAGAAAQGWARGLGAPLTLAALLTYYAIGRWYDKQKLRPVARKDRPKQELIYPAAALGGALTVVTSLVFQKPFDPPFSLLVVIMGIMMLLVGFNGLEWRHYTILGLLAIAIGILPASHLVAKQLFNEGLDYFVVGAALLIAGLLDHQILVRRL